jgi:hypothetical protein
MFDFLRKAGSWAKSKLGTVGSAVIGGARKTFGFAKKASDAIKGVYHKATSIPIIGNMIREGIDAIGNTTIDGVPIGTAVKVLDSAIQRGNSMLNPETPAAAPQQQQQPRRRRR